VTARPERPRAAAAAAIGVAALLFAWVAWQPEASDRASNEALELTERGELGPALAKARDAHDANPLSARPLLVEASIHTAAGREPAALRALERAVLRYPGDPQTWLRLAAFELGTLDRPEAALESLQGALYLDPRSNPGHRLFLDARTRLREKQAGP
jgi:tetratricopeptide (TPR) repeat protein